MAAAGVDVSAAVTASSGSLHGARRSPAAMRVMVTGGTGYLGSAIVRALVRHGHEPVVFARRASAAGLPGTAVDGDIRDRHAVTRAAAGADAICHAAALVAAWAPRPAEFDEVNVGGLGSAIDAASTHGLSRIVYTSSFLAAPRADGAVLRRMQDYQRTKARAREVARAAAAAGVPIVSMVPGVIYGPGAATEGNLVGRLIREHLAGTLPGLVGAGRLWSYAYVDDVAEAHVTALCRGEVGAEYPLGGENAPQMRVFEILREMTGMRLPRRLPLAVASAVAALEEARAGFTGRAPVLTRATVEILRRDWVLDSSRSVEALGYRIRPLREGVHATLMAMRHGL
jgi:nucleoside-diphosphate-sugar epimerase